MIVPFIMGTATAKTLKIGSMSPLTGPYASDGTDIKNGVLTAIQVFEEAGGVPGYDKIELFPQDTACDPKQAVAAANKLINLEVVGVVGAYCSSSTIPASETLAEEDIPMLTPASTNEKVTDRGLPYMFRLCGRDDDQAPAAAKFLKESAERQDRFHRRRQNHLLPGTGRRRQQGRQGTGNQSGRARSRQPGRQGLRRRADQGQTGQCRRFLHVPAGLFPRRLMALQAKRIGLKSQIVTQDAMFQPKFMEVAKDAAEGVYLTYGFTDKTTPEYKNFEKIYVPKYGAIAAYATYAYDAATVLLQAIKNAGSTDPAKIKAEIMKMDFDGVAKRIKFRANGDSGSSYIAYKIDKGQFVPYWAS
jgi:branched-chain amino acid transport system substrate-binding protein